MRVTQLPKPGDLSKTIRRLKYDVAFEAGGMKYEAEVGEWVVITWEYKKGDWEYLSMREAIPEEIEDAKGPVRWWQWLRKRRLQKANTLPEARLLSEQG